MGGKLHISVIYFSFFLSLKFKFLIKNAFPISKLYVFYLTDEFVSVILFSSENNDLPMTKIINTKVKKNKRKERT